MERKKKKIYLVTLWIITLAVIVGACFYRFSFGEKGELAVADFEKQDVTKVNLDMDIGDVEIKYGPTFQVEYYYPKKFAPKVELNNGVLTIQQSQKNWNFNGNFFGQNEKNYEMTITIPKGSDLSDLDIDLDLGDLELEGLVADTLTINNELGDVNIHNCQGKNIDITAKLGNVNFTNSVYPTVIVNADLGDVNLDGDFDSIDAHVDLGDLDIRTEKPTDDVKIKAACELGDIEVNGEDW
ncbi:DUF4097 family beta strand repeat-containing protein [Pseudobutyrivibrio sp.]|uniref:DUF4097 family beta strand repeat-containing protein n=1 Tax=Pseudobutyrivibrio sp. TaxID=2014367 RepID=UPI0025E42F0A|nr:DUF4097 family beta strand repeat-containing protein [Pseudobutyrivibrio sp.]